MLQYLIAFIVIASFISVFVIKPSVEIFIKSTLWSFPFLDAKILPLEYGFVKVFDVFAVFAFIFLFKRICTVKNSKANIGYLIFAFLFIIIVLVSKCFSEFPYEKLYTIYQLFTLFIFTRLLISYLYEDFSRRYKLINILKITFILFVFIMVLQFFFGTSITYYNEISSNAIGESFSETRFPGLFIDSQTSGQFLAMASFLCLITGPKLNRRNKVFHLFGFFIVSICVVLAGSRSALGGYLVGLVIYFLFATLRTKLLMSVLGVLVSIIILFAKPNAVIFKRTETAGDDFSFREAIWIETIEIVENNPLLGIGMGNYRKYIMNYYQDLNIVLEPGVEYYYFVQPESGYLKIMVEHGVVGFILFFMLVLTPVVKNVFGLINRSVNREVIYVLCSVIAFFIAFTTLYSFADYRIICLFSFLISLLILYQNSRINKLVKR